VPGFGGQGDRLAPFVDPLAFFAVYAFASLPETVRRYRWCATSDALAGQQVGPMIAVCGMAIAMFIHAVQMRCASALR
jgi:hypothetical protein